MRWCLSVLLCLLSGCGVDEMYSSAKFVCGSGMPCGDIYSQDLLQANTTTIAALRAYMLNKDLSRRYANTPFKQEDDGQGDLDDLMRGLMVVKKLHSINPIFALALSIHESGWGTSEQATDKYNLWGWNAYDGKEHLATTFESFTQGFNTVFKFIKRSYLIRDGRFYQACTTSQKLTRFTRKGGCTLKDCGASLAGMNCMYASDNGWARQVREHMNNITAFINNDMSAATACAFGDAKY